MLHRGSAAYKVFALQEDELIVRYAINSNPSLTTIAKPNKAKIPKIVNSVALDSYHLPPKDIVRQKYLACCKNKL